MNVLIINPPVVQYNSPYPSGAYLKSFFKSQNCNVEWYDLNINFFYSIFSRDGLSKLFSLAEKQALKMAIKSQKVRQDSVSFNLRRYISTKDYWINWIDFIVDNLCSPSKKSTRELEHEFLYSPFVPRGNRMENFLSNLNREPVIDDVKYLCTFAIADLCDFISAVFDSEFNFIRYADSVSYKLEEISLWDEKCNSPIMKEFYYPLLNKIFKNRIKEKTLVCISVPFAGTFIPSLVTAKFFKDNFAENVFVSLGGGFVNTELRNYKDINFSKYVDALSFDRGYGSYKEFFDKGIIESFYSSNFKNSIYKMRLFSKAIIEPVWKSAEYENFEDEATVSTFPDYSSIDFSIYPRMCDDFNAMHRMWSDGTWIKAYLAHGCYWHKCAFCDTKLDYVCSYKPVHVENLFENINRTAKEKNIFGIHFVDEAMPISLLKKISLLNCQKNGNYQKLMFWGNVRFEKCFTKDAASFLSYGGLRAVSGGIEVATMQGLKNINKGTDIQSIVNSLAAFKESGILVHAYMIYGFWYDNAQTIIDSMETLRQFFENGLLDSAFWHKFMLTQNSVLYDELKDSWNGGIEFEKFGPSLEKALNYWMKGLKIETKVQKWFDFQVPSPTIPKDYIEKCIQKYEFETRKSYDLVKENSEIERMYWLGSKPLYLENEIFWNYFLEEFSLSLSIKDLDICDLLYTLRPEEGEEKRKKTLSIINASDEIKRVLENFRGRGLVLI